MAVHIKRYANRKLYNTETSRYITLSDISDLVRAGREIHVVDNKTGHDISSLVLSRVLVDTERRGPVSGAGSGSGESAGAPVLGELLQRQLGSVVTLLRRYADDVQGNLTGVRKNVVRWIHSGAESGGAELPAEIDRAELERVIQQAVEAALRQLALPSRADLHALHERLDRLAESLQKLSDRT